MSLTRFVPGTSPDKQPKIKIFVRHWIRFFFFIALWIGASLTPNFNACPLSSAPFVDDFHRNCYTIVGLAVENVKTKNAPLESVGAREKNAGP